VKGENINHPDSADFKIQIFPHLRTQGFAGRIFEFRP
jgi:hypothetical protein